MKSSRSISASSRSGPPVVIAAAAVLVLATALTDASDTNRPIINVVYPKPDQVVTATDSTFILGNVGISDDYVLDWLTVNDCPVEVHEGGGFLAFTKPLRHCVPKFRLHISGFAYAA